MGQPTIVNEGRCYYCASCFTAWTSGGFLLFGNFFAFLQRPTNKSSLAIFPWWGSEHRVPFIMYEGTSIHVIVLDLSLLFFIQHRSICFVPFHHQGTEPNFKEKYPITNDISGCECFPGTIDRTGVLAGIDEHNKLLMMPVDQQKKEKREGNRIEYPSGMSSHV